MGVAVSFAFVWDASDFVRRVFAIGNRVVGSGLSGVEVSETGDTMNPEPPPIADPHEEAPEKTRNAQTIVSALAFGCVGVLLFLLGAVVVEQLAEIWFDPVKSHDFDVTAFLLGVPVACLLCPLGFLLVRHATSIWNRSNPLASSR